MQPIAVKPRSLSAAWCFAESRAMLSQAVQIWGQNLEWPETEERHSRNIVAGHRDAAKNQFGVPDARSLKR
jgi:hypothetical protein